MYNGNEKLRIGELAAITNVSKRTIDYYTNFGLLKAHRTPSNYRYYEREAIEKIKSLPDEIKSNSKFHFIGHLQTNKVNKVVCNFDVIHSVDSLKLAKAISEEAVKIGKVQDVFIQLNNANEEQKFGFSKQELLENFSSIIKLEGLNVLGLMNIAPLEVDKSELEKLFEDVKQTQFELVNKYNCEMKEISMGMSNDYQIAAKHGATMLRIGRKLFSTT